MLQFSIKTNVSLAPPPIETLYTCGAKRLFFDNYLPKNTLFAPQVLGGLFRRTLYAPRYENRTVLERCPCCAATKPSLELKESKPDPTYNCNAAVAKEAHGHRV
jgi:hypothetical protein